MALYNIYAGITDSEYKYTREYENKYDAEVDAYDAAVEDYHSYEGLHGIPSYDEIEEQYCEDHNLIREELINADYEEIDTKYTEIIECWISYYAVLAEEDDNIEESERDIR